MKVTAEFASAQLTQAVDAMRAQLSAIQAAGGDPAWLGEIAEFEAKQAGQGFATNGAATGKAWPDLLQGVGNMDAYVKWKRRNWSGRKMNVWRGDTRDSLRYVSDPRHIARLRNGHFEFGTNAPLAAKMQTGERHSTWQKAFLREKSPVMPKGSRRVQNRGPITGRFLKGHHREKNGRLVTGRNWFTFWYKEIPARPVVRKSADQIVQLKLKIAQVMLKTMAQRIPQGWMARQLGRAAGAIRPKVS